MKIVIHDYGKYPFILELGRKLAEKGNDVYFLYNASFLGPNTQSKNTSFNKFDIEGISIGTAVAKYNYLKRFFQEKAYSNAVYQRISTLNPDIIISANTPLATVGKLLAWSKKNDKKYIFWVQDIWSLAVKNILSKKNRLLGAVIGTYYMARERHYIQASFANIVISSFFLEVFKKNKIKTDNSHIIENWAPLNEIVPVEKKNDWSIKNKLDDVFCFMYTGTLGMKHNPELLVALAQTFTNRARVVVVSQGKGAEILKEQKAKQKLENLTIMDFQPQEQLSNVLGTADVLVSILEDEAGEFSVPSKVLTYHCAQRPILLSVPVKNLIAKTIKENGSGISVDCNNKKEFITNAEKLFSSAEIRQELSKKARQYAEKAFDINQKYDAIAKIIL